MLNEKMENAHVTLVPFEDCHIEGLRQACEVDQEIWKIYPVSMMGEHFLPSLNSMRANTQRVVFAVLKDNQIVGMTSYIGLPDPDIIEIGGTYITPDMRGTKLNTAMKKLMINRAFADNCTKNCVKKYRAVCFKVDTRNTRSMRAVEKLGAVHVETLLKNTKTWTGYIRDMAIFRLDRESWMTGLGSV